MIKDITITNSRSFKDTVVFSMEATSSESKSQNLINISEEEALLKVGVLFGPNASGKTNLVQLLWELQGFVIGRDNWQTDLNGHYFPFWFNTNSLHRDIKIKIRFLYNNVDYVYSISFNKDMFTYEYLGIGEDEEGDAENAVWLLRRQITQVGNHVFQINSDIFGAFLVPNEVKPNQTALNVFLSVQLDKISPAAHYLANVKIANGYNDKMMEFLWHDAQSWLKGNEDRQKKLLSFLSHVDIGIKRFTLPTSEKGTSDFTDVQVYHDMFNDNHKKVNYFRSPIGFESFGSRRLFLLGAKILDSLETGMPFIADEMDANFHSFITQFIIRIYQDERINRNNAQLIFTTHDTNVMDEKLLRKDQIWFVQKDVEGASQLYSLADFNDVEENTSFADWYLAKRFGAVPDIDSLSSLFGNEQTD